jgi:hypothetical protein
MLPAFATTQLDEYLSTIQQCATQVCFELLIKQSKVKKLQCTERLKIELDKGQDTVNFSQWLSRLALDIIGRTYVLPTYCIV